LSLKTRLLVAHGIMGSKPLSRLLCYASKYFNVEAVILLGNTISPSVVRWLSHTCGLKVFGVLGRHDSAATASALSSINGLIDCKMVTFKGVTLYGLGLSGCTGPLPAGHVDVVVSSLPGLKYGCCKPRSDVVDHYVDALRPRLVVTGLCNKPCSAGSVFSPGSLALGYIGLLDLTEDGHVVRAVNVHTYCQLTSPQPLKTPL